MRISDWSSDVCSSDLAHARRLLLLGPLSRERRAHPFELAEQLRGRAAGVEIFDSLAVEAPALHMLLGADRRIAVIAPVIRPRRPAFTQFAALQQDRKSVVSGKSVSIHVGLGSR